MPSFLRRWRGEPAEPEQDPELPRPDAQSGAEAQPEATSPLADRLAHMEWPSAPDDVKERCLREILERVAEGEPRAEGERRGERARRAAG